MVADTQGSLPSSVSLSSSSPDSVLSHFTGRPLQLHVLLPPHYCSLFWLPLLHPAPRPQGSNGKAEQEGSLCSLLFITAQSWTCCWSWGLGMVSREKLETRGSEGISRAGVSHPALDGEQQRRVWVGPHMGAVYAEDMAGRHPSTRLGCALSEKS